MKTIITILVVLAVAGGGAYFLTASEEQPDPRNKAVAEALALHTRALQAALHDECTDTRQKLKTWQKLRKAGTPDPDDSKEARKTLRKMLKAGCRENS